MELAMRTKVFFVTAVALLWSVSVFSQTKDIPVGVFVNGNELFRVCADGHDGAEGYCRGYVVGVADAISVVNAQLKANGLATAVPSTCVPYRNAETTHGAEPEQVRDVVVQYLTAHPETRHQAAAAEAWKALLAAFPCK
jgi:hypothetical protein